MNQLLPPTLTVIGRRDPARPPTEAASFVANLGLRLHGFGVKTAGLQRYGQYLASADSLAWSLRGRQTAGCAHSLLGRARRPNSEANCLTFALEWRERLLNARHDRAGDVHNGALPLAA